MKDKPRTIKEILNEEVEVEKFKDLIKDMHRGFPNFEYKGMVEEVIITEKVRDELEKHGFLIKEKFTGEDGKPHDMWGLGISALQLVSSWKMEELGKETLKVSERTKILNSNINFLTKALLGMGIITLVLVFIQTISVLPKFVNIIRTIFRLF